MTAMDVLVDSVRLSELVEAVLLAAGFRDADAALVAEVLVEADLRGVDSHGVTRLFGYLEMIDAGHVNPQPEVSVEKESGATALLDGDSGIGIIAARQAMDRAIALSAESGIACVSLRNVSHTGLLGFYTMRAARQGLIGIAMNNGPCMTPPFGGLEPVAATNPLSIAAPSGGPHPVALDMATTTFGNVAGRSDQHRPGLEHRFTQQHARQHRKPGIVPFEDRQVLGQPLVGPDGRGGQFHHFVKPKERITVRNQRLDRRAIQHHRPLALIIHQTFAGASSLSTSLATITP